VICQAATTNIAQQHCYPSCRWQTGIAYSYRGVQRGCYVGAVAHPSHPHRSRALPQSSVGDGARPRHRQRAERSLAPSMTVRCDAAAAAGIALIS
jgi:hypothetical protein